MPNTTKHLGTVEDATQATTTTLPWRAMEPKIPTQSTCSKVAHAKNHQGFVTSATLLAALTYRSQQRNWRPWPPFPVLERELSAERPLESESYSMGREGRQCESNLDLPPFSFHSVLLVSPALVSFFCSVS